MEPGELVGYVLAAFFAMYAVIVLLVAAVCFVALVLVGALSLFMDKTEWKDSDAA